MDHIKAIVFDKDGTLFDFARTWEAWAQSFLIRLAETPDQADLLGAVIGFNTSTTSFAPDSVVIAGTPFDVAETLAPHINHMSVFDIVTLLNEEAARAPQAEAVPLAGFLDGLQARGLTLGVATNDAEAPARAHLQSAGVLDRFQFIAGCDTGYGGKPAPGQLLAFANEMKLAPEACVMVGDSLHDLRAGRSAGFMTVGVLTGYATQAELQPFSDVVMPNIGHIPEWLDGL